MRTLNYSKTLREQARERATLAEMIDIDSFLLALDDIDSLESECYENEQDRLLLKSLLAGKEQAINETLIELQQANERIEYLQKVLQQSKRKNYVWRRIKNGRVEYALIYFNLDIRHSVLFQ